MFVRNSPMQTNNVKETIKRVNDYQTETNEIAVVRIYTYSFDVLH